MSLLLPVDELLGRRAIAAGSLKPLADSLAVDFSTVAGRPLYVPEEKALLSREGGRCSRDGTMLSFDPFSARLHVCPMCGEKYAGEVHDRFWVYWYQLWLAERAVHGAVLGALGIHAGGFAFTDSVLSAYTKRYGTYANSDNALGPTRPFFSTYLESIWLLQLCVAVSVVESVDGRLPSAGRFRDEVVEPSLALIASYDEGSSNRQVWNNAAMMAASIVLGRNDDAEEVLWAESGVAAHLNDSLLRDGTWYEGENYHLFAHRGLWYGITMAEQLGAPIDEPLLARFNDGFAAPFLTALPDFTLPSRRDSQYAISLRQWRFAEMCEIGLGRTADRTLTSSLAHLYDEEVPRGDTGRSRSSAEVERNTAPSSLTRADLGWRSLLFARAELPPLTKAPMLSVLLEGQGVGVLRRDAGNVYTALDFGNSGGGHGQPDRLNLLLARGDIRWFDDYGTGSYVDPSLHWYRSTLAHNAPMVDGRSQPRHDGWLEAFEDRGGAGWIVASFPIGSDRHAATRTLVAMPDYVVDELRWNVPNAQWLDLPFHFDAHRVDEVETATNLELIGSRGLEDGFRFLRDPRRIAVVEAEHVCRFGATTGGQSLDMWLSSDGPFEVWRATAPAAPGRGDASFILVRANRESGTVRSVLSWSGAVESAVLVPQIEVVTQEGRHVHTRVDHGWNVAIHVEHARSSIDLEGRVARSIDEDFDLDEGIAASGANAVVLRRGQPLRVSLGEESYNRSEATWAQAGSPTADIVLTNDDGALMLTVAVHQVDPCYAEPGAVNRLDNESADINGAGVQIYLRDGDVTAGYVVVPDKLASTPAVRAIDGWGDAIPVVARSSRLVDGFEVTLRVPAGALTPDELVELDIVINEKPMGRERRRGQLALSGGGQFIYLRGDRHDPNRLHPFVLTND